MRYLFLLAATMLASPAGARDLTVMSFNVRVPVEADGPNRWLARRDIFIDTIRRADPDIIGTQELKREQGDYIVAKLPNWRWFGRDRRGGHSDEHMGIFYRTDRLKLVSRGDFWLSDTPETVGSNTWGNVLPRMVNWGVFERTDGTRFTLYDTHFPYRDQDEAAREKSAALIATRMAPLTGPLILTGDFNTTPDTPTHATLAKTLRDAREGVAQASGPEGTFHDFTGTPGKRIDWIFARGATPVTYRTIDDNLRGRYPSDHFPVVATFRLEE